MGDMISISEAADLLGITVQGVHKRIAAGSISGQKVNGHWVVDYSSVVDSAQHAPRVGRPRKGQPYILMNRTHEVMAFSVDREAGLFLPREVYDPLRAPIGTVTRQGRGSSSGLAVWWGHRSIPGSRADMDRKLADLGLTDAAQIPFRSLGFSLSDQYWVKPEGTSLAWEDLNYFHHPFGKSEGTWDGWLGDVGLSSPDNTSEGALPKRWVCEGEKRILIKGHNPWTDQQVYNEAVATALHRRILEPQEYVPYEVRRIAEAGVVSACGCFLHDDEEYVPLSLVDGVERDLPGETKYDAVVRKSVNLGIPREDVKRHLAKMIVCDSLMANTDRHLRNFGYIRDVETLQWRMAPIFDSGNSLWYDKDESDVARGDHGFVSRPFVVAPNRQLMLTVGDDWFEMDLLDGFIDEAVEILAAGNISAWRLDYLREGIQERIDALRTIWG